VTLPPGVSANGCAAELAGESVTTPDATCSATNASDGVPGGDGEGALRTGEGERRRHQHRGAHRYPAR